MVMAKSLEAPHGARFLSFKFLSFKLIQGHERDFQVALVVKNLPANAGDVRDTNLVPGLG